MKRVHESIERPEYLLEQSLLAAERSGQILLSYFGKLQAGQIGSKSSSRDLVTEADVTSERHLVEVLRELTPSFAIEAEEEVCDARTDDDTPRWFLDPLDGTVNFVHGLPMFSVSMGLMVGDEAQLAVIHLPYLRETFCALRGGGARLNGEPLHVSKVSELGNAVLATGFPYRRNELEHSNLENFSRFFYDVRGMRRMGSAAIDLCYVAAGKLDGYWELHLAPHDVAGGALIVSEAGGLVTDAEGGQDWLRGGHIVAGGPGLHEAIRERIEH